MLYTCAVFYFWASLLSWKSICDEVSYNKPSYFMYCVPDHNHRRCIFLIEIFCIADFMRSWLVIYSLGVIWCISFILYKIKNRGFSYTFKFQLIIETSLLLDICFIDMHCWWPLNLNIYLNLFCCCTAIVFSLSCTNCNAGLEL